MKLPNKDAMNEVLVVRIDEATKKRLQELAKKNNKWGNNSSDVVRTLIDSAHSKRF